MARSTKQAWLEGPGDLKTAEVVIDIPKKGDTLLVRGLPAEYSNRAQSEATETKATADGRAVVTINKAKMEVLQLAYGAINDDGSLFFTEEEAQSVSEKYGPAFHRVIAQIDKLSDLDKEEITKAEARFPDSKTEEASEALQNGADPAAAAGSGGPDVPVRAGAGDGEDDQGTLNG